jgi:catechol 2,3-dioxygenase-like lactoylglutathione lyase family enzyme
MADFAIDHVQIAIPGGGEELGRSFFGALLGLREIPKPAAAGAGGCWFEMDGGQIHLGVDPDFRPARKAHVALQASSLPQVRGCLREAGYETTDSAPVGGRARFFTHDPFGNRIEFIERAG